jgi:hypothetical protein
MARNKKKWVHKPPCEEVIEKPEIIEVKKGLFILCFD